LLATSLILTLAAAPTADEILAKADAIIAPERYESDVTMTTIRANGEERSFQMHIFKNGDDLHRIKFVAPTDDKGSEVLRNGDDMWNYLPNLKRALKISSKQEFHGGDFSNADMLRSNLSKDYTPKLVETTADEYQLELKAKSDQVAYDTIKYWLRKKDCMPLREEFYTSSGKLIRKLEYQDPKKFGKLERPSKLMMWNVLTPSRHSEMKINEFAVKADMPAGLFNLASLGK
jgi:outer membrane lipoprotein-sorting protein